MRSTRLVLAGLTALAMAGTSAATVPSSAASSGTAARAIANQPAPAPRGQAVAVGGGGAVASVDPYATRIGLRILRRGGTAADAAVATAAALGVTEPYSAGIGGGGYFVHYSAETGQIDVLDGRESAPQSIRRNAFINPRTGRPYRFFPELVTSGVSVGVPGTPRTWSRALRDYGTLSLDRALAPAARLARQGFVVDETFNLQTAENAERFAALRSTRRLFLRGGAAPAVGSLFRNPDLARTYRLLGRGGVQELYDGTLGAQIARVVQDPPTVENPGLPVPPGTMTRADLRDYRVIARRPTHVGYRGFDVYGMPPSSSGGSTVGEALGVLRHLEVSEADPVQSLHSYLEASAVAFADREAYVGDPAYVDVPLRQLLSRGYAQERACTIDSDAAADKPVDAGVPDGSYSDCSRGGPAPPRTDHHEGRSTTHLTVADRFGNVVAYTLTIEQTGGSGIVVPGRGFLLNNELTDFSLEYVRGDPNRIQGGKRPRSSMSPSLVLKDDKPWLALGSPGGSTIITTVLQVLLNRIDLDLSLPAAIAAPRANQGNTADVVAEQVFIDRYGGRLEAYGHSFVPPGEPGTSAAEIGAVAAIRLLPGGRFRAAAEPERRGGGAAGVVNPQAP